MANPHSPVIVIAPDSFKGSLDARTVAAAIASGLVRVWPAAEVRACPMADGGEGTLDVVMSRGGDRHVMSVSGAGGRARDAAYGIIETTGGSTAVIEAAEIVGITDRDAMDVPVDERTTQGV